MVFVDGKYWGPITRFERWGGVHGFDVVFYINQWGYSDAVAVHYTNVNLVQPD